MWTVVKRKFLSLFIAVIMIKEKIIIDKLITKITPFFSTKSFIVPIYIFILIFTPDSSYLQETKKSNIDIYMKDSLVSIHAINADIKDILKELSDKALMKLEINDRISEDITIDISNVSIEKAIKQIAKNWAIVYVVDPLTGKQKIKKIDVFDTSTAASQNLLSNYFKVKPNLTYLIKAWIPVREWNLSN